jgi:hypothetical protein
MAEMGQTAYPQQDLSQELLKVAVDAAERQHVEMSDDGRSFMVDRIAYGLSQLRAGNHSGRRGKPAAGVV